MHIGMGSGLPVVAEVVRGGSVESVHHGIAAGLGPDGAVVLAAGHPERPVFGRSSLKPVQALAMLRAGLDIDGALLAIVAGSHSGEDMHVTVVRAVLDHAGLTEGALQCPPDLPFDLAAAGAHLHAGTGPRPALMNCSGKHAGMLATCVAAGWPTGNYLDPAHPLQQAIRATLAELADEPVSTATVDGCGAPLFAVSLLGLARAVRALVLAPPGSLERRVVDAMRAHPHLVAGTGRGDTRLMRAVPGLVVKSGAEGVAVAAAPDGRTCAVKIADGSGRASTPVLIAALGALGVVPAPLPVSTTGSRAGISEDTAGIAPTGDEAPGELPGVGIPGDTGDNDPGQAGISDSAAGSAPPGGEAPAGHVPAGHVPAGHVPAGHVPATGIRRADMTGDDIPRLDLAALADLAAPPVLGGGRRVGEVRTRPLTTAPDSPSPSPQH